jgi:hypothetical protein
VGVQSPGGACGAELFAEVDAQRVAQLVFGVGQRAERPRNELAGALLVLKSERDSELTCSSWRSTGGSDSENAVRIQYACTAFCPAW